MAMKLPPEELKKLRMGDFGHYTEGLEPPKRNPPPETQETKRKGGNPNGRGPSKTPRNGNLHIRLSDADQTKLEEAARITSKTKTVLIVEGIDYIYSKAIAAAKNHS